jgi:hypothetical protein
MRVWATGRAGLARKAKEDAIGYASARAKFGHGGIRMLKHDELVEECHQSLGVSLKCVVGATYH